MIGGIKKYILGNDVKSVTSPYTFVILILFSMLTMVHYALLFEASDLRVRMILNMGMLVSFIALERSPLRANHLSVLVPSVLVTFLMVGAIYFNGDFLIYVYTIGGAMVSLTYLNANGLLSYLLFMGIVQGVAIIGFDLRPMGSGFTIAQNTAGWITAIGLNLTVWAFCVSYTKLVKSKEIFLSRMSHELRTPISAVMGIAEIELKNTQRTEREKESFYRIQQSARTLLHIINDVLDLSRLRAGEMRVIRRSYNVLGLIDEVSHLYQGRKDEREVAFELEISEELPLMLKGDRLRVSQIMMNLLSNAFKYTDRGQVLMRVWLAPHEVLTEKGFLCFEIRDTGLGMTPGQLADIRQEYARFHEEERPYAVGTGLGMPIVYQLVGLMKGDIFIESEVGVGTSVTVRVPSTIIGEALIGKEGVAQLKSFMVTTSEEYNQVIAEDMSYGKVLIVDDIEANLYVMEGLLGFYRLHVDRCSSGRTVLDKVKAGNVYDLILIDSMMPGLDGTQTLHHLRDMDYTHPVVVVTANALVGMQEKYEAEGFDAYLSKPVKSRLLHEVLVKYVRRDRPAPHSSQTPMAEFQTDEALMTRLRQDFVKDQPLMHKQMLTEIEIGDFKAAHIKAHTLKGLAGMIAETELVESAKAVETALASGMAPSEAALVAMGQSFDQVIQGLYHLERLQPELKERSGMEAVTLLKTLIPLLEENRIDAVNLCDELVTIPEARIIAKQIQEFELTQALENTKILLEILENQA